MLNQRSAVVNFLTRLFFPNVPREPVFDLVWLYLVIARKVPEDFIWFDRSQLYHFLSFLLQQGYYTLAVDKFLSNTVDALLEYPEISLDAAFFERLKYVVDESELDKDNRDLVFIVDFYENQRKQASASE